MIKKIEIQKLKASFSEELESEGERVFLNISINDKLKDLLKEICLNDKTTTRLYLGREIENDTNDYTNLTRYKVKAIIYRELTNDYKDILFLTKLFDKQKVTIKFHNISCLESAKAGFIESLKRVVEICGNISLKQDVLFRTE